MTGIKEFEYLKEPKAIDLEYTVSVSIEIDDDTRNRQGDLAITLDPSYLGFNANTGWEVYGKIHENFYEWVNYFEAENKEKDYIVWGDFENEFINGNSKEAIEDFMCNYPYEVWDYGNI